jgi:sulfofructose kinase
MIKSPIQVFGLGQCALDYITRIESYPTADTKCECSGLIVDGGGPIATAMVALSRWGIKSAFTGVVGDDRFGRVIRESLEHEGVDTRGLRTRADSESQFAFIVAEPGIGRRTVFWRRPTGASLEPDEIDYELLQHADIFHTDGFFPEASIAAAKAARRMGVRVVVDAGSMRDGMLDLARLSDYFIASETFAHALVDDDNPKEACKMIAELGPPIACVTLGRRGYVALDISRIIEQPVYPVNPVDTTGCGDLFHAGFVYGVVSGWEVETCFNFAAWSAAMVSRELGGRKGIPTIEEWDQVQRDK